MSSQQCILDLLSKPWHLRAKREHSIRSASAQCCQDFHPLSLLQPHSLARVQQSPPPYRGEAELCGELGQHPNSESGQLRVKMQTLLSQERVKLVILFTKDLGLLPLF